jgi:periplasmic divalent cation tolerance protein
MIAVYVTFPDKESAKTISHKLLEQKLIACANIQPIESHYLWNDNIESSSEFVAIYKTQHKHFPILENVILSEHPYEIPCITYWKIESNEAYKQWVIRESSHGTLNVE